MEVTAPPPHDGGLAVSDVVVNYGPVRALRGVSLRVPPGSIVTVLGTNGAGKTTLLRAISGTLRFHRGGIAAGTVTWAGERLSGIPAPAVVARGVTQVPEGRRVFGRMTVEDNLRAGALGAGGGRAAAQAREQVHSLFPVLAERAHQRAGLLSGGEQQMLAIGRALMARPSLLLLDEPTLGLAPLVAARIAETIRQINADGTSVLLIEQNAATALSLASYAYVLEVGEVALEGPTTELALGDEVRRRYLGVTDAPGDGAGRPGPPGDGGARRPAARPRPALARWFA
ncbi:ABC transporter ATP-binding protein [Sphaerisporangium sp. TRM90804]|uniref:ABC transporter ATP-binding protein n=1 Tax=Sphaerisporangium sp. TRM90804 TaxID=3031113 RepID=UPI00244895B6|nr:ABC transporter ATP-binding protein [Sphaerisporangium sp. TRM90804]MDH2430725.1 ABC transporter ATP-binding protein [Sphaerisporangium sp. TRM90804]